MEIYIFDINDTKNIDETLLMQFQHKTFSNTKQQKQHSLAYLMLDRILKDIYKIENYELFFENNKPYIKGSQKYFSISHSGEYVAICFSDYNCGVDIEQIKKRQYKKISQRMGFKSETLEDFYKNWTEYEAEYKLDSKPKSMKNIQIQNYILTAVSTNLNEKFEVYFQISEYIPNVSN